MAEDVSKTNDSRRYTVLGIVVAVLAIIGAVTIISGCVRGIKTAVNKNNKADTYKALIAPVIMNDPDSFDDVINADQKQLISISIWSLLQGDIDPDSFKSTKKGILIGTDLVEQEFAKLFGKDVAPLHQSVSAGEGVTFEYNKSKKAYVVPITGITALYTPKITEINEKGSSVILTVGYLANEDWVIDSQGNAVEPEPVKYMRVYLRENGNGYYISSLKQTDGLEIVTEKATSEIQKTTETTKKSKTK